MRQTLSTIRTPALVVDLAVLRRNVAAMSRRAAERGVDLRPHCKTAKSVEIARLATARHSGAITVSTLREAEHFIGAGFSDITYSLGIAPDKLPRVAELQREGARVYVLTDNLAIAKQIAVRARETGSSFGVFIEIDTGYHRAGVDPESDELLAIGRALYAKPAVELSGVLTHAGHAYQAQSVESIREIAEQERAGVVRAAQRLREAGLNCPIVSVGSTPTAVHGGSLAGVDEMRPGNFVFFDLMMVALGVCGYEEIAVSVLTTVIGHQPAHGHALTDAGALALSKDTGIRRPGRPYGAFGLVRTLEDPAPLEGIAVTNVSQEHGWIGRVDPDGSCSLDRLPLGGRVRIVPNHACHTAAAHDRYHVVDGTDEIVATWPRTLGW